MSTSSEAAPLGPGSLSARGRAAWDRSRAGSTQLWWQLAGGLLLGAYLASLFLVHRPKSGYSSLWDGWISNTASTLPALPILLRVWRKTTMRAAWALMAAGILLYNAGDLIYLFHDQNLNPVPSPAPSDVAFLLAYSSFALAAVMMTQHAIGRGHASARLDGAITGLTLGAAAVMVWFEPLLRIGGGSLQVAVGMAYPLLDLVIMVVLIAGLAPHGYRMSWSNGVLLGGFGFFVIGDVIYLRQTVAGTYVQGTLLDATWSIGMFLMGVAAWSREAKTGSDGTREGPRGFAVVPVGFGLLAVLVLVITLFRQTSAVASAMALGALALVIVRMAFTLREVRRSAGSHREARTDELTGVHNRRAFLEDIEVRLRSAPADQHVGVVLIDLDGFKEVNDSLGHRAGDELLRIVANRFGRALAEQGTFARLGGDEFATSCLVTTSQELVDLAHRLAAALVEPISLDGVAVRVGASIGVALSPEHGSTHSDLLRSADVAMYEAKRAQCVVCLYEPGRDLNSRERLALIQELRLAIEGCGLILHFQPTVDMRTATVRGVEALVRWNHPTRGLLYPDDFIPLAERVGLIPKLTRAVLELALSETARLNRAGHQLQMSVNISRYDLIDEELPVVIDEVLARHRVTPDQLTLEVTESSIGEDPERARRCIDQLRARGIRISIDDFGVGYSSLSQLLAIPIDELKIDKSFVMALESDQRAHAIISSTVELGRALAVDVVAEGVEGATAYSSLTGLGADVAQGYHIARPLDSDQLDAFLDRPIPHRSLVGDGSPALSMFNLRSERRLSERSVGPLIRSRGN